MQNNFISVKDFEDTPTIYSASKPVEIFMGSDTENIIDTLFNTILNRIQEAMETSNERGSGFTHKSIGLLYYHFQRIDIRRGGPYIASPKWVVNKKATINPKDEKDNECFRWSIIAELNTLIALNILFISHNSEEINLAYKSRYNKRKNQVILLMINDEANNCYYFALKNLSELNSSIINSDFDFEDTLDDALNYQNIETHPERILKLKPYINKYNWKGIDFPAGPKEWIKFEKKKDNCT